MTYRSHTCGELRGKDKDNRVVLSGWVARMRDLGGFQFLDIRDRYGKTQVVAGDSQAIIEVMKGLKCEDVIRVEGVVRPRPEEMINRSMLTGEIEVAADRIDVLSRSVPLPLGVEDLEDASDELRLKYRYLDLRRPRMSRNLALRHRALQSVRRFHDENGFIEVETPLMICNTPEGARDYIVPSRLHPGSFYSLPQSPQLYKQALMIGGIDRYFQIARCFRDEDLRRDRQPEFTQIDIEMTFVEESDVFSHTEKMIQRLVKDVLDRDIELPFPRITYQDALEKYGSDAPDTRYEFPIHRVDAAFIGSDFKAFNQVVTGGGSVFGLCGRGKGELSRKQREELEDLARTEGLAGLLSAAVTEEGLKGVLGKVLSPENQAYLCRELGAAGGDLLMFAAGEPLRSLESLGRIRRILAERWGLIPEGRMNFCWVVDAPLFELNPDGDGVTAVHHPFTMPLEDDVSIMLSEPLKVRSRAYDLVLNGIEMATGSIRIHDRALQEKVFQAIGIDRAEAQKRFGFLLEALTYGAPPHGGIALGFDRLVMVFAGESSIREVIAFPKSNTAVSLMDGAPSEINPEVLSELGLQLVRLSKKT